MSDVAHDDLINVSRATLKNELKVRDERLLRVAQLLEKLKPTKEKHFSLSGWFYQEPKCGTTACACGWVGTDPWFNERGFTLKYTALGRKGRAAYPRYKGFEDWEAIMQFFRLTKDEAYHLFLGLRYPRKDIDNPKAVARRIRQFVKNGLPE
jgi:hypothetical protein